MVTKQANQHQHKKDSPKANSDQKENIYSGHHTHFHFTHSLVVVFVIVGVLGVLLQVSNIVPRAPAVG
jgi:membrane-bound metal-dependent hydrolase YbcI (DUF457 family)